MEAKTLNKPFWWLIMFGLLHNNNSQANPKPNPDPNPHLGKKYSLENLRQSEYFYLSCLC